MIHLPLYLEKKLKQLFPRAQDRYDFVSSLVKDALGQMEASQEKADKMVGGTIRLFTDGGSRGNPGQAAIGYVVEDSNTGSILEEHGELIGECTNNVAEYKALIEGLERVVEFHPNKLICQLDSELIVKQLNGQYRVKMPSLQVFVEKIQELVKEFASVEFRHIPRIDNHRADALVNQALDKAGYKKKAFSY